MVSLFLEYPVGSLLVWKTDNPPEIKNDAINRKEPVGLWKILLDGQQRLTTLYLLIKGEIPPYYKEDEITQDPRNLYFSVETGEFSYYSKQKMEGNPSWKKVVDCFNQDFDAFTLVEEMDIENSDERLRVGKKINTILGNLRAILKTDTPIQEVPTSACIDEAIDVFDRVNSKGTKLTEAELVFDAYYWEMAASPPGNEKQNLADGIKRLFLLCRLPEESGFFHQMHSCVHDAIGFVKQECEIKVRGFLKERLP